MGLTIHAHTVSEHPGVKNTFSSSIFYKKTKDRRKIMEKQQEMRGKKTIFPYPSGVLSCFSFLMTDLETEPQEEGWTGQQDATLLTKQMGQARRWEDRHTDIQPERLN